MASFPSWLFLLLLALAFERLKEGLRCFFGVAVVGLLFLFGILADLLEFLFLHLPKDARVERKF
jgi:hypothetical protein